MNKAVIQLTVTEFAEKQKLEADNTILLDVREPWEIKLASVNGSMDIPMHLIPDRISELDVNKNVVVMCHHGGRSQQVAQYLLHHGFENVYNLSGGIHAWSTDVDSEVPQY